MSDITGEQPGSGADDPTEIPLGGWKQIALRVKDEFGSDHVTLSASGVAFHGFLALVPLIAAAVSIYGLVADPANVRRLIGRLRGAVPDDVASLLENQLDTISTASAGALGVGAVIGILTGLWSASSGVGHLIEGINIAYDEDADDRPFWKRRALAVLLTLLFIALLAVAATVVTLTASVNGVAGVLAQVIGWIFIAVLFGLLLAVFFRFATDRDEPEWVWVSPGAVFSVVAWTIASVGFGIYVSNFGSYNETYGSLGAIVVVLMWLFISATVVIVGAELNAEIERQTDHDSTQGPEQPKGQRDAVVADDDLTASGAK